MTEAPHMLNPEQEGVVASLVRRIRNMRYGGHGDAVIRASLIAAEGWPVGAVNEAFRRASDDTTT